VFYVLGRKSRQPIDQNVDEGCVPCSQRKKYWKLSKVWIKGCVQGSKSRIAIEKSRDKGLCSIFPDLKLSKVWIKDCVIYMFPEARVDWQLIKVWIKDVFHVSEGKKYRN
jgi:hypothetical protein